MILGLPVPILTRYPILLTDGLILKEKASAIEIQCDRRAKVIGLRIFLVCHDLAILIMHPRIEPF